MAAATPAVLDEASAQHILADMERVRPPFSFREDPAIRPFDDARPLAVVDGECALCSWGAKLITRLDTAGRVQITPFQSPLGRSLLIHYGIDPDTPQSWLFIADGRAHSGLRGVAAVGRTVRGWGWPLALLGVLPRPVSDWLYRRAERNRIAWFGRTDLCTIPDDKLRARLIA